MCLYRGVNTEVAGSLLRVCRAKGENLHLGWGSDRFLVSLCRQAVAAQNLGRD